MSSNTRTASTGSKTAVKDAKAEERNDDATAQEAVAEGKAETLSEAVSSTLGSQFGIDFASRERVISGDMRPAIMEVTAPGQSAPLYVREWVSVNVFGMVRCAKAIMEKAIKADILGRREGETDGERIGRMILGILDTVAESEKQLMAILQTSVFVSKTCKENDALATEHINNLVMEDMIVLLHAIFSLNWEKGGLGKFFGGAPAVAKTEE